MGALPPAPIEMIIGGAHILSDLASTVVFSAGF